MAAPRNDDVRERILEEASGLITQKGFDSVSLAMIAEACGISKGTLYYHFKTKEDIVLELQNRYFQQQKELWNLWMDDESKDTSLNRLIMYVLQRNYHDVGSRFHLLYQACTGNEHLRDEMVERYTEFQKMIADKIMERDKYSKEVADYVAWLCLLATDGMIVQSQLQNDAFDPDAFIRDSEQILKEILE